MIYGPTGPYNHLLCLQGVIMKIRCVLAMTLFCSNCLANGISLNNERIQNLGMYIMMSKHIEAIGLSSCGELIDVVGSINDNKKKVIINAFNPENRRQVSDMLDYDASRYTNFIEATVERDHKNRAGGRVESCERLMKYYVTQKSLYNSNIFN